MWLTIDGKKTSLFDLFGKDFTLLCFNHGEGGDWLQASRSMGFSLCILPIDDSNTHDLYDADLVLIRPDHHVAWRGDATANPANVLALVSAKNPSIRLFKKS
jgi:hypothetical protein